MEATSADPASAVPSPADHISPRLRGALQILVTSGETLPNVIGLRAFESTECLLIDTPEEPSARLSGILRRLGVRVLDTSAEGFRLDAMRIGHNEKVGQSVARFLESHHPGRPLIWNFTPGTKPIAVGLGKGLAPLLTGRLEELYVDTRYREPLFLSSSRDALPMRGMTISELLIAQGVYWRSAIELDERVIAAPALRPPFDTVNRWVSERFERGEARFADGNDDAAALRADRVKLAVGEWLTCVMAQQILRKRLAEEVWMNVKVSTSPRFTDDATQELDLVFATGNNLCLCECKLRRQERAYSDRAGREVVEIFRPADSLLKLKQVAKTYGGRHAIPVLICNQGLVTNSLREKGRNLGVAVVAVDIARPAGAIKELTRDIKSARPVGAS